MATADNYTAEVDFANLLDTNGAKSIAVVCLNTDDATTYPIDLLLQLKNRIVYLALVDGACNLFYDTSNLRANFIPQLVTGDFDSARPDVLKYYQNLSETEVMHTADQERTDFDKCLSCLLESQVDTAEDSRLSSNVGNKSVSCILVLGSLGGRLDHTMGNLNTLVKWSHVRIYFATRQDLWICLPPEIGELSGVRCRLRRPQMGDYVSLVPMVGPCLNVHSTGLRWNLTGNSLQFGGLVSTSNEAVSDCVTVRWAGGHLLITVTYRLTAQA